MVKFKSRYGGKDMVDSYMKKEDTSMDNKKDASNGTLRDTSNRSREVRMRNIQKFLDGRAYEDCEVRLRPDFGGEKKEPIKGKFAGFSPQLGVLVTDTTNNKHFLLPNRGIIELIEFTRRE